MHHSGATDKSGYLVKIKFYSYPPFTGNKKTTKTRALGTHSNRLTRAAQLSTNHKNKTNKKKKKKKEKKQKKKTPSPNTQSHPGLCKFKINTIHLHVHKIVYLSINRYSTDYSIIYSIIYN